MKGGSWVMGSAAPRKEEKETSEPELPNGLEEDVEPVVVSETGGLKEVGIVVAVVDRAEAIAKENAEDMLKTDRAWAAEEGLVVAGGCT